MTTTRTTGIQAALYQYFRLHPGIELSLAEITGATGYTRRQVQGAIAGLRRTGARITSARQGFYSFHPGEPVLINVPAPPAASEPEPQPALDWDDDALPPAPPRHRGYLPVGQGPTVIDKLDDDRALLSMDGGVWYAKRVPLEDL